MVKIDIDHGMEITLHHLYLQQLLVQLYHHVLIFVRRDQSLLVKNIVANAVLSLQFCNHNSIIKDKVRRRHFIKFEDSWTVRFTLLTLDDSVLFLVEGDTKLLQLEKTLHDPCLLL